MRQWGEAERKDICRRLSAYSVPELCDGMDYPEAMDSGIRRYVGTGTVVGTALTVKVPAGQSGLVPEAILRLREGEVLVISGRGHVLHSFWGDHRSLCAKKLGAAAVVIDGAFRDLEGCRAVGLPLFARGLTAVTAGKEKAGVIGEALACGGLVVRTGDLIAADENAVCVIRPEEAERLLARTYRKTQAQKAVEAEMEQTGQIIPNIKWDRTVGH